MWSRAVPIAAWALPSSSDDRIARVLNQVVLQLQRLARLLGALALQHEARIILRLVNVLDHTPLRIRPIVRSRLALEHSAHRVLPRRDPRISHFPRHDAFPQTTALPGYRVQHGRRCTSRPFKVLSAAPDAVQVKWLLILILPIVFAGFIGAVIEIHTWRYRDLTGRPLPAGMKRETVGLADGSLCVGRRSGIFPVGLPHELSRNAEGSWQDCDYGQTPVPDPSGIDHLGGRRGA